MRPPTIASPAGSSPPASLRHPRHPRHRQSRPARRCRSSSASAASSHPFPPSPPCASWCPCPCYPRRPSPLPPAQRGRKCFAAGPRGKAQRGAKSAQRCHCDQPTDCWRSAPIETSPVPASWLRQAPPAAPSCPAWAQEQARQPAAPAAAALHRRCQTSRLHCSWLQQLPLQCCDGQAERPAAKSLPTVRRQADGRSWQGFGCTRQWLSKLVTKGPDSSGGKTRLQGVTGRPSAASAAPKAAQGDWGGCWRRAECSPAMRRAPQLANAAASGAAALGAPCAPVAPTHPFRLTHAQPHAVTAGSIENRHRFRAVAPPAAAKPHQSVVQLLGRHLGVASSCSVTRRPLVAHPRPGGAAAAVAASEHSTQPTQLTAHSHERQGQPKGCGQHIPAHMGQGGVPGEGRGARTAGRRSWPGRYCHASCSWSGASYHAVP